MTGAGPARSWRVSVTGDCLGSGVCVATARAHFRIVDGYAQPVAAQVAPDDDVLAAAELCPATAILIDGQLPDSST